MAETALKFGPEWLRALSHPGTNNQNNQSLPNFMGNPPKYKLADYRYGREEMLALFDKNSKMPDSIKDLTMISSEKCQLPLALVSMSDEEQRMWSRSVNSEALNRIGKGGSAPSSATRGRGGSIDRGRGRGRGTGAFFQRGSSFDDLDGPPGGLSRTRAFERSANPTDRTEGYWDDSRERRFDRPFSGRGDENGTVGRKELSRGGGASDGWRGSSREPEKSREEENGWRSVGRGPEKWNGNTGKSWRTDKEDWDRRDGDQIGSMRNGPTSRGSHQNQLPEWSREDDCDAEQVGTFDSAGAFMETKEERISSRNERSSSHENEEFTKENKLSPDKDPVIEKVKKSGANSANIGRGEEAPKSNKNSLVSTELNNGSTHINVESQKRTKNLREEPQNTVQRGPSSEGIVLQKSDSVVIQEHQPQQKLPPPRQLPNQMRQSSASPDDDLNRAMLEASKKTNPGLMNVKPVISAQHKVYNSSIQSVPVSEKMTVPSSRASAERTEKPTDDDNFALLEKAAENMMAKWTAEEEQRTVAHIASQSVDKVSVLPIHHEDAYKWFYRDPQSLVQGPFTSQEMLDWFSAGYFTMGLMVRRGCDERFSQLGELIRNWGRVPFLTGGSPPPPLRAQPLNNVPPHQQPLTQGVVLPPPPTMPHPLVSAPQQPNQQTPDHEQQMRLMILHQQLIQQQLLYKQHFQVQNLLGHLKQDENFQNLPREQQQQVLLQHLIAQQQLQRAAPAGMSDLPSLPDPLAQLQLPLLGLTLPPLIGSDNPSLWNLAPNQNNHPNPPNVSWPLGVPNQPKNPGNSIWDIEVPNQAEVEAQQKASRERKEKEEEEQRRLKEAEEERQKQQMIEEQRRRLAAEQEEKRRQEEEMKRKREEEEKRRMEEQRAEDEHRRKEEERRILEERFKAIRLAEEQSIKQRELLNKRIEEERLKKQKEDELMRKKIEEIARKEQIEKAREEEKRREEEKQKREMERQEIERRENEIRALQQQEALKKMQEQQRAKSQLPPWLISDSLDDDNTLSLAQIQQLEKERLAMEREERKRILQLEQREREMLQAQAAQQMKNATFSWAQNFKAVEPDPVKTLLEIQQEEAERLAREEKQQPKPVQNVLSQNSSGVWNNAASNLSWAASNKDGGWNMVETQNSNSRGFWDDAVTIVSQTTVSTSNSNSKQPKAAKPTPGSESAFPALAKPAQSSNSGSSNKAKNIRAKKNEENVMKLFETHKLKNSDDDNFTQWCTKALSSMAHSIDIPIFIGFLQDVESPYEVHDYVKSYLGEGKEAREFAKQFLERRSKLKNQTKITVAEENMWGPAPAITPSQTKTQQQIHADFEANHFTTVGNSTSTANSKTKKKKTKKMQKLDMSLLGFTVQADPDRINVGEIDRLDAI